MTTNNPRMWTYWRDKYGTESALTDYYADLLRDDPHLSYALMQMIMAREYIDTRMAEHADAAEELGG